MRRIFDESDKILNVASFLYIYIYISVTSNAIVSRCVVENTYGFLEVMYGSTDII